jgi:hypothetical protein
MADGAAGTAGAAADDVAARVAASDATANALSFPPLWSSFCCSKSAWFS